MLDCTCAISKHLSKLDIKLCGGLICAQSKRITVRNFTLEQDA